MKLSEVNVIRSDLLPERTMYVSPDIFAMLTSTDEKQKAQIDNIVRLSEWIKDKGQPK